MRLRLLKVDATERGVAWLETAKEGALHWVPRGVDCILGRLLCRALRLLVVLVLYWRCRRLHLSSLFFRVGCFGLNVSDP